MTSPWAPLQTKMAAVGLTQGTPGYEIVGKAKLLPPPPNSGKLFGDAPAQAMPKLLRSYYEYGRAHWVWTTTSPGSSGNGGLVRGQAQSVACGAFNYNFKWLAENALGITGMGVGQDTSQFITMPGGVCIDAKWPGNVRTANKDFAQLKCFKFQGHYWVTYGGKNLDTCFNNTFGSTSQIIWSTLGSPDPQLLKKSGLRSDQLYKLEKKNAYGDHLVMLKQQGYGAWPTWQLMTTAEVAAGGLKVL
jgi:hypothetical protein